jgi:hypothetical protein
LYYWYAYMINNVLHADITLMLLLYYIGVSIATEVLVVNYKAVIFRWWNKPFKKNIVRS